MTTSCTPPTAGCGYNYYWDSYSCMCKYYTTSCVPPSAGCGNNKYWDYSLCTCKDYISGTQSCAQPPAGCGYNYYWDTAACQCKPNPNVTTCIQPATSCSSNTYWDQYSCSCKNTYVSYTQTNFDRLAYEPPERISCIKNILSSYEFERLRYFIPGTSAEQNELYQLGNKVKACWTSTASQSITGVPINASGTKTPADYESCLIKNLGDSAYKEIFSGVRTPTYEEHLKYKACYSGNTNTAAIEYYSSEEKLPTTVEACLKTVLAGGLYTKIKTGQSEVPFELRDQVNRCFGVNPQPFEEVRKYQIPEFIKSCLLESLGENRFNEINSGQIQPSAEERNKADDCFAKLNSDQRKFLPAPPEEVHFLDESSDDIQIAGVTQDLQEINGVSAGGVLKLAGKSLPGSVVNLYIFSDPIVVTTKTDENGDWVYELNQPLSGEKHIAYATVRAKDGRLVRSTLINFEVQAAPEESALQQFIQEEEATGTQRSFLYYSVIVLMFITVGVLGVIAIINFKKLKNPQVPGI